MVHIWDNHYLLHGWWCKKATISYSKTRLYPYIFPQVYSIFRYNLRAGQIIDGGGEIAKTTLGWPVDYLGSCTINGGGGNLITRTSVMLFMGYSIGLYERVLSGSVFDHTYNRMAFSIQSSIQYGYITKGGSAKGSYLLLYSITLRTVWHSAFTHQYNMGI